MADTEKKEEVKIVTLLNRSKRHFDTLDANGKAFRHAPGAMASYTEEQAAMLTGYSTEMIDITKLPGAVDTTKLKSENATLLAEKKRLEALVASLQSAAAVPVAADQAEAPAAVAPAKYKKEKVAA